MSFDAGDFGFCGPAYTAPMILQDDQESINWYLERDPQERAKEPLAMLGAPGLNPLWSTLVGQARGAWVLPGGQEALIVVSSIVYLVTITVQATQTSIPQFTLTQVGALATNSGPVCMRDNGVIDNGKGGFVFIVDGQFWYYYAIEGITTTVQFTGGVMSGSNIISLPSTLPAGLIISSAAILTDASGYIQFGTILSSIDYNTPALQMSSAATNTNASETITLTIPAFGQITDPGVVPANRLAFIEGWILAGQIGTRNFISTGPTPYTQTFPPSFFALKDSSTDNLITLFENNRELWLIGERTSEVWFNSGLTNFPFSRIPGVGPQIGCAAVNSITRFGTQLAWLGQNEQGQNIVVMSAQYSWTRISNHGVEHAISTYPVTADAIGYAYEEEGHLFYMLTFPTADITWCYDAASGQWHKRLSWDSQAAVYHRHRSNCYMDFGNVRIVGDYQTGQFHQMSRQFYTDAGAPLRALRRTPHIWQKGKRQRVFFAQLQIEFTPGVGLQTGQGSNPQCMLRWSSDGGFTWSTEQWAPIGAAGETRNRAIWYLLGEDRDRVWEASFTDPVPRDIIGATAYMEPAVN